MMTADTEVNILLNNLTHLLKNEPELLSGVEEKVKLLQQEVEWINAFLRGSEGKVKAVVRQIRDVACEAQDVIDNYVGQVFTHRKRGMLRKFFQTFDHAAMLNSVNNQIENIKDKISNKDKYDINEEGESTTEANKSDVDEEEVLGFNEYADQVIKLLVEGNTSRQVVSIVGMVGFGKTTLARKVFKDVTSSSIFDCLAWEFPTKDSNAQELLLSLLRSFKAIPEDELKPIVMLKNMLREYLSDRRYLIVIDDVWSSQVWEEIGDAFPDDNLGSRILITTCSEEVASKFSTNELYKVKSLSDEDSWTLLSNKVFRGEKCPPILETVGRNIAIACNGLPLSIVVIAGILRSKEKSEQVWEKVLENVNWYISYETLPQRLKPCFLYFGIYPEDYEIPVRQLIQLWIAEGFIPKTGHGGKIEEDVGEEYLEELIRRNLIQVESRRMDGGVKTCRIDDFLRELCMSQSTEENFFHVRDDISLLEEGKPRRLSIHGSITYYMSGSPCDHSTTRSLFIFSDDEYDASAFATWLGKNFKLIRVVDMAKMKYLCNVVNKLEELNHLRYFRAIDAGLSFNFPNSIYDMWNLETLDLRGSTSDALPDGIWKLKQLRHLHMYGSSTKATLPNIPGRKVLPNIQTLSGLWLNKITIEQLQKGAFPNLKKLGVDCYWTDITNPIEHLGRLQCLRNLNTLKVSYGRECLTSVEGFPQNITKISLIGGNHLSKIVGPLGSLPKLLYLKISKELGYPFEFKLECIGSGCFPQLQVLKMTDLTSVSWNLGEGAMPRLTHLVINNCKFSTSLPSAESFTSLQEVQVVWSSKEVVDELKNIVVQLKNSCKLTID